MTYDGYEDWLAHQKELARDGLQLIEDAKLEGKLIDEERKPSFIRVFFGSQYVDFRVKEVKTRFARSIWLCKVSDLHPKTNWLIHCIKENQWNIVTAQHASRGERKPSDYHNGKVYIVIPSEYFRGAKTFFKNMKKRLDDQLQKRISDF